MLAVLISPVLIPDDSIINRSSIKAHVTIRVDMGIFDIFTNFLTSVFIGYLAFTNTLAEKIESYLPEQDAVEIATAPEVPPAEQTLSKLTELSKTLAHGVPRILLEHAEYQRAAIYASTRDDEPVDLSGKSLDAIVRDALVNIYCQYKTDRYIRTTTGTGFFINQKGVIITNAHVAQFLLLKDAKSSVNDVECVIRSGEPAEAKYNAELLYISPTWIFENADLITDESPRGTGERDYALLYVSKTLDGSPLPAHFPVIPVAVDLLSRESAGAKVLTAGYPAEALMRNGADAKLNPVLAATTVGTLYTFGSNYADIFSISESPVGEQGASGGPIVAEKDSTAIGLIVTKGDEETEGAHSLRALTLSYINRTMTEETGFSLIQNMQGDIAYRAGIFKEAMVPFLAQILADELSTGND